MTFPFFSLIAATFYAGWLWHGQDAREPRKPNDKIATDEKPPEVTTVKPTRGTDNGFLFQRLRVEVRSVISKALSD